MRLRLWAGALALCLCLAGCAGAEKEPGEVSSRPLESSESGSEERPESVPAQEGQPLSFDLRALPSEGLEDALFGDGFEDMLTAPGGTPLLAWADAGHLIFCAGRFPVPLSGPGDLRVFCYDLTAGETALLWETSDPKCDLAVDGAFIREGIPYLLLRKGRGAIALRMDLKEGTAEALDAWEGPLSRVGTSFQTNLDSDDVIVCDFLEPETVLARVPCPPGESVESLSPDGGYLAFRVEDKPAFALYALDGRRLAEISPLYRDWLWCETPSYLAYSPADDPRHTVLLDLERGTETVLPIDPERDCTPLLVEPEFSLLRTLDGETGAESIQLLDNRTGTLNPLEIVPGEGRTFAGQLVAYDPERTAAAILSFTTAPDGSDRRAEGYLLKLSF